MFITVFKFKSVLSILFYLLTYSVSFSVSEPFYFQSRDLRVKYICELNFDLSIS